MYAHMILRRLGYKFLLNVMYYYNYMRYLCTPALAKTRLNWSSFKICSVFSEAGFKEPGNVPGLSAPLFDLCDPYSDSLSVLPRPGGYYWSVSLKVPSQLSVTLLPDSGTETTFFFWTIESVFLLSLCWGCICFWTSGHDYWRRLCPVLDFLLQRILVISNGLRSPWYTTYFTIWCFSFYIWIFLFWRVP